MDQRTADRTPVGLAVQRALVQVRQQPMGRGVGGREESELADLAEARDVRLDGDRILSDGLRLY